MRRMNRSMCFPLVLVLIFAALWALPFELKARCCREDAAAPFTSAANSVPSGHFKSTYRPDRKDCIAGCECCCARDACPPEGAVHTSCPCQCSLPPARDNAVVRFSETTQPQRRTSDIGGIFVDGADSKSRHIRSSSVPFDPRFTPSWHSPPLYITKCVLRN